MNCPVHSDLHFAGKKFSITILEEIKNNSFKFNEFIRKNKITPKLLSQRLTELQTSNIIEKDIQQNYSLTDKGQSFLKIINEIKEFNSKWNKVNENCAKNSCSDCDFDTKP